MRRAAGDRVPRVGVDGEFETRREPYRAKGAQAVLAHPLVGYADRADDPTLEVEASPERVADLARPGRERDGVDREIPACEVVVERGAELDLRVATVWLDVA